MAHAPGNGGQHQGMVAAELLAEELLLFWEIRGSPE
jgi:hypothetical protein